MRKYIRAAFITFFSFFRGRKPGVYILNGHFASPTKSENLNEFRNLLSKLKKGCEFIDINTAIDYINNPENRDAKKTYLAFTFDDGFKDCFTTIAPILEEFNVNAVFFINPNFVVADSSYINEFVNKIVKTPTKEPMNWEQIVDLDRRGFIIGNHTLDHFRLAELTKEEAYEQIVHSKKQIENKLQKECDFFAWPYGQFDDINTDALNVALGNHRYVFSGCDYKNEFSFEGKVFNRRHFEASWSYLHVKYFLTFYRK